MFQRNKQRYKLRIPESVDTGKGEGAPELSFQDPAFRMFIFSDQNPSLSLRHMAAMSSWFYHYSASECICTLQVPTLIMIGQEDPICDALTLAKQLRQIQNPKVAFHILANCGHAVFEDQEDMFLALIRQFLS